MEALSSVWSVVHMINKCPEFHISHMESHEEQGKLPQDFRGQAPGIPNCVKTNQGILLWTLKPSLKYANQAGIGQLEILMWKKTQILADLSGSVSLLLLRLYPQYFYQLWRFKF